MQRVKPYYDPRGVDMRVPEAGLVPFPVAGSAPNAPFAPGKTWIPQRILLGAGSANKRQIYQNPTPCQKVVVQNEGAGDLIVGNQGLSLAAPTAGNPTAAFNVAVGAALTIEVEDASQIWIGSVAGTTVSVALMGSSYVSNPQYQYSPNYVLVPK